MKRWTLLSVAALTLTACQGNQNKVVNVMGEAVISKVTLPESVAADGTLKIAVNVELNGCITFQSFEVQQRTATSLKLLARANFPQGVTCPAVVIYEDQIYTDSATLPRTNPFEVFVNGQSYGTISIR